MMMIHYVKHVSRSYKKEKLNYLTAILGLAVAICAFFLIFAYCLYFYNYDKQIDDYRNWYRLRVTVKTEITEYKNSLFYGSFVKRIVKEVPDIKDFIEITMFSNLNMRYNYKDSPIKMDNPLFVTDNLIKHFKMKFIYGNPELKALGNNELIVSESFSKRTFGNKNPVGDSIFINTRSLYKVVGVFRDLPGNLSYRSDTYRCAVAGNIYSQFSPFDNFTHIRLKITDNKKVSRIEKNIEVFLMKNRDKENLKNTFKVKLDPISKMHFINGLKGETKTTKLMNIHLALLVSILLLIAALFNFINLHQLIWQKRYAEFIFRKTLGAEPKDLLKQLSAEYLISLVISFIIGIILYSFSFKTFSKIINYDLNRYSLSNSSLSILILGLVFVCGLIISIVSIIRISHKNDVSETSRFKNKEKGSNLFLIIQLIISLIFISSALVVNAQYRLISNYDLGFKTKNLIEYYFISVENKALGFNSYGQISEIIAQLKKIKGVISIGMSNISIVNELEDKNNHFVEPQFYLKTEKGKVSLDFKQFASNKSFIENLKIKLLSGRYPNPKLPNEILINKTFKDTYFKNTNPLGIKIYSDIKDESGSPFALVITGVLADADFYALHYKRPAISFIFTDKYAEHYQIYYNQAYNKNVLIEIEQIFNNSVKGIFDYRKKDISHALASYYTENKTNKNIIIFFAFITSIISIMGSYSITQTHIRRYMKEVSLHKIHGAEPKDIIKIYGKPYMIMFSISTLIGLFISYYLSKLFLDLFVKQIKTLPILFVISVIICGLLVFVPLIINILWAYHTKASDYLSDN